MREVVIVKALRTPIGKIRGQLSPVRPDDLLATVFANLMAQVGEHSELTPSQLDEVYAGCANQAGEDNRNVARMASLLAGFPDHVPGITVNRLCASGLDAVVHGYRSIAMGDHSWVLAGGVESMTRAPLSMAKGAVGFATGAPEVFDTSLGWRFPNPKMAERFPLESMGETAENIAERYGFSRDAQDAFALASHQKAVAAWSAGRFDDEIVPVTVKTRKSSTVFERDEGPRAESSMEALGKLRAVFRQGGTVTAGNASTLNDGAAAILMTTAEEAREKGLEVMGVIRGTASAGVDPRVMGLGPIPATQKALARAGITVKDLDLVELNEAFAVQSLAVIKDLGLNPDTVNVNGGAIALGHPLGCSGTRILTTLVHEMARRKSRYGLATLCVGVGQGVSVVVER